MGKIRYVCTTCANGFTTKAAASRHVKNVEQGNGWVVTEANYRTGLVKGVFFPVFARQPPKYKKTDSPPSELPRKPSMEEEEYKRGFWRRAGELVCEEAFRDVNKRQMIKMQLDIFALDKMMKTMADMRASSTENSNI
jgi:hypothetical protein